MPTTLSPEEQERRNAQILNQQQEKDVSTEKQASEPNRGTDFDASAAVDQMLNDKSEGTGASATESTNFGERAVANQAVLNQQINEVTVKNQQQNLGKQQTLVDELAQTIVNIHGVQDKVTANANGQLETQLQITQLDREVSDYERNELLQVNTETVQANEERKSFAERLNREEQEALDEYYDTQESIQKYNEGNIFQQIIGAFINPVLQAKNDITRQRITQIRADKQAARLDLGAEHDFNTKVVKLNTMEQAKQFQQISDAQALLDIQATEGAQLNNALKSYQQKYNLSKESIAQISSLIQNTNATATTIGNLVRDQLAWEQWRATADKFDDENEFKKALNVTVAQLKAQGVEGFANATADEMFRNITGQVSTFDAGQLRLFMDSFRQGNLKLYSANEIALDPSTTFMDKRTALLASIDANGADSMEGQAAAQMLATMDNIASSDEVSQAVNARALEYTNNIGKQPTAEMIQQWRAEETDRAFNSVAADAMNTPYVASRVQMPSPSDDPTVADGSPFKEMTYDLGTTASNYGNTFSNQTLELVESGKVTMDNVEEFAEAAAKYHAKEMANVQNAQGIPVEHWNAALQIPKFNRFGKVAPGVGVGAPDTTIYDLSNPLGIQAYVQELIIKKEAAQASRQLGISSAFLD